MDSPLLPTFRNQNTSPSSLLADLSLIGDDEPLSPSPVKPSARGHPSHASQTSHTSHTTSHTSSSSGLEAGDTPQKPRAKPRFSLFAPSQPSVSALKGSRRAAFENDAVDEGENDGNENVGEAGEEVDVRQRGEPVVKQTSAEREDRLRESLYELRAMNEVFDGFLGALESARGHNERLSIRVSQTSRLLDQYTALLGQTEHTQRLLGNPNWTGAEDDAAVLANEAAAQAAEELARSEEVRRKAQAERAAGEERERLAREAAVVRELGGGGRGGQRGRGAGTGRGASGGTRGRGTGLPRPSVASGLKTPSAPGVKKSVPGGGTTGGLYANVKSSGYGPGVKRG